MAKWAGALIHVTHSTHIMLWKHPQISPSCQVRKDYKEGHTQGLCSTNNLWDSKIWWDHLVGNKGQVLDVTATVTTGIQSPHESGHSVTSYTGLNVASLNGIVLSLYQTSGYANALRGSGLIYGLNYLLKTSFIPHMSWSSAAQCVMHVAVETEILHTPV